jgi:hypothetical protein
MSNLKNHRISKLKIPQPAKEPPWVLSGLNYKKAAFLKKTWEKAGPFGLAFGFFKCKSNLKTKPNTPLILSGTQDTLILSSTY